MDICIKINIYLLILMSFLLDKAEQNQKASLLLFGEHQLCAAAVHAAYYSCLQMMIHILLKNHWKTTALYDKIQKEGSSHNFYISEVGKIVENRNRTDYRTFKKITELKRVRVDADYKDMNIDPDTGDKALTLAQNIQDLLRKFI